MSETTVLKNNSDNEALPDSGSTLLGSHLKSRSANQQIYGRYNKIDSDASADMVQIGAGRKGAEFNAFRVDQYGNPTIMGGEIYMDSTVGSIQLRTPILVEINNKVKKVYTE